MRAVRATYADTTIVLLRNALWTWTTPSQRRPPCNMYVRPIRVQGLFIVRLDVAHYVLPCHGDRVLRNSMAFGTWANNLGKSSVALCARTCT